MNTVHILNEISRSFGDSKNPVVLSDIEQGEDSRYLNAVIDSKHLSNIPVYISLYVDTEIINIKLALLYNKSMFLDQNFKHSDKWMFGVIRAVIEKKITDEMKRLEKGEKK